MAGICAILPFPARVGTSVSGRTGAFKALFVNGRSSRLCHIPSTTGFFGQVVTGGVGLSGHRGEIGNHKVAGKIGVTTMAGLPRNQELARQLNELAGFLIPYPATGESSPRFASLQRLASIWRNATWPPRPLPATKCSRSNSGARTMVRRPPSIRGHMTHAHIEYAFR